MFRMKRIPGYPRYSISRDGRVWSHKQNRRLIPATDRGGYEYVHLYRNDKQHAYYIHALLLRTFVGPCPVGMKGLHIDGDPTNNSLTNLEYAFLRGERNGTHILTEPQVLEIRRRYATGKTSYAKLGREYGVGNTTICHVIKRTSWAWLNETTAKRPVTAPPA